MILSELLEQYGKMPSFHDARLLEVTYWPNTLNTRFYLYEQPVRGKTKQEWDQDLHIICLLSFEGLKEYRVRLEYNSIGQATFAMRDGLCYVEISGDNRGEGGLIVSERVRVLDIEYPETAYKWKGQDTGFTEWTICNKLNEEV